MRHYTFTFVNLSLLRSSIEHALKGLQQTNEGLLQFTPSFKKVDSINATCLALVPRLAVIGDICQCPVGNYMKSDWDFVEWQNIVQVFQAINCIPENERKDGVHAFVLRTDKTERVVLVFDFRNGFEVRVLSWGREVNERINVHYPFTITND